MHVSPSGDRRQRLAHMEPGQSYDIEIAVPADHTRGTYWYHPHHHGSADVQISSGMAGALIVEGDFAGVAGDRRRRERVLILNEVMFDYQGMRSRIYDTLWPEAAPRFLSINGQRRADHPTCGRAKCSAGASSRPRTRTICGSPWRITCCTRSPMTASSSRIERLEEPGDRAGPAGRRAGAGGRARHLRSCRRSPTTRAIRRRRARWRTSWSRASRCR